MNQGGEYSPSIYLGCLFIPPIVYVKEMYLREKLENIERKKKNTKFTYVLCFYVEITTATFTYKSEKLLHPVLQLIIFT